MGGVNAAGAQLLDALSRLALFADLDRAELETLAAMAEEATSPRATGSFGAGRTTSACT